MPERDERPDRFIGIEPKGSGEPFSIPYGSVRPRTRAQDSIPYGSVGPNAPAPVAQTPSQQTPPTLPPTSESKK